MNLVEGSTKNSFDNEALATLLALNGILKDKKKKIISEKVFKLSMWMTLLRFIRCSLYKRKLKRVLTAFNRE